MHMSLMLWHSLSHNDYNEHHHVHTRLSVSIADIVIKIITKKLGDKYYKKKGVVVEVKAKYTAVVKLLDSGEKLKLDQTHLETVLPAIG